MAWYHTVETEIFILLAKKGNVKINNEHYHVFFQLTWEKREYWLQLESLFLQKFRNCLNEIITRMISLNSVFVGDFDQETAPNLYY